MRRFLSSLLVVALVIQFSGCGTLLHPERKGQTGGKIDVGIALLDGIGLLFFLIPGIIAYAVDFSNGTIYLPPGDRVNIEKKDLKQVKFDPKTTSAADIERIVKAETGKDVKMDQANMKVTKLKSTEEMLAFFKENKITQVASAN